MSAHHDHLKRTLKNRHIQLIALGGAIGTGLFLGLAEVIQTAGPSLLLGYLLVGGINFLMMRQLGEMVVEEPVAGTFGYFANRYWSHFAGFLSGWNYWTLYITVCMAELTAIGLYVEFWVPWIPTWISALVFFLLVNTVNLANVKLFGEFEFWFALVKVVAILGMIVWGGFLLFGGMEQASFTNLWSHGGFFPHGIYGWMMSLVIVVFSFGGIELVGMTAAEADHPKQTIPKAINLVVYRILILYVGSVAILLSLFPWNQFQSNTSPFVMVFFQLGQHITAHILNIIVLTASLSAYNSGVYCTSRMLYGLAQQGHAPRWIANVNQRGVPLVALGCSALVTLVCMVINYLAPKQAFQLFIALTVAAQVINLAMVSLTHLRFRRAKQKAGVKIHFPALGFPWANYLCLFFMVFIVCLLWHQSQYRIAVLLIPIWLCILGLGYWRYQKSSRSRA